MNRVLLDTDVIIAHFRNEQFIVQYLEQLVEEENKLAVSPIAYTEIYAGMRKGEEKIIANFFRALECLPIDKTVGRKAGEYLLNFSKSAGVKIADALVAAVAYVHQAHLLTLNRKHYPMKDLKLLTPPKDRS